MRDVAIHNSGDCWKVKSCFENVFDHVPSVLLKPAGAQGSQGAQGSHGAQGSQGPQGTQAPLGTQGAQGPLGTHGSQGAQGSQGPLVAQLGMHGAH